MLHYIITIILGIVATFFGVVTFYALRRINMYENIILNINNTVESIKLQLKTIDDKGTFESDDEVGFFFQEVKQRVNSFSYHTNNYPDIYFKIKSHMCLYKSSIYIKLSQLITTIITYYIILFAAIISTPTLFIQQ